MGKNIIFVFTGTGNSLWAAKEIAKELEHCEIATMGSNGISTLSGRYDRIGFVYPTYAGGMPRRVKEFVAQLDLTDNKDAWYFAIATCGRIARAPNVITQMRRYLKRKSIRLNYGERLDMFSNYVILYEMRKTVREEAEQSAADLQPMIARIKNRTSDHDSSSLTLRHIESMGFMRITHRMDKGFRVSDACTGCGICKKVCPVDNIRAEADGAPVFLHHCEQCLACLQNCPARAINYKDKTQDRRRYVHPDIRWSELAALNLPKKE